MRAVLVSRSRGSTPLRGSDLVAQGLLDAGIDVGVLYSRATLLDQARAGIGRKEWGSAPLSDPARERKRRRAARPDARCLGARAGLPVEGVSRLGDLAPFVASPLTFSSSWVLTSWPPPCLPYHGWAPSTPTTVCCPPTAA